MMPTSQVLISLYWVHVSVATAFLAECIRITVIRHNIDPTIALISAVLRFCTEVHTTRTALKYVRTRSNDPRTEYAWQYRGVWVHKKDNKLAVSALHAQI